MTNIGGRMDRLTGFVVRAEKITAKSVINFSQGLGEYNTIFELVEALVIWVNDEMGENFQLKDLNDIENYRSDRVGGDK